MIVQAILRVRHSPPFLLLYTLGSTISCSTAVGCTAPVLSSALLVKSPKSVGFWGSQISAPTNFKSAFSWCGVAGSLSSSLLSLELVVKIYVGESGFPIQVLPTIWWIQLDGKC